MKDKCDKCDKKASFHSVEIVKGQKTEINLCEVHAAQESKVAKAVHTPINELLSSFVKAQSGQPVTEEALCGECGQTFSQFRETSLMGCPSCYAAFEEKLTPMLERIHEGGTHHLGKIPKRSGVAEQKQAALLRMRKQLAEAVAAENFELAARLRDEVRRFEEQTT
ncbi:MAG: UvrB/UvrC motif-containing protein [Planctomycetota bacterium]|nr:UvrB/UvrC motif-containing protein [Planctomycetota bacterium]